MSALLNGVVLLIRRPLLQSLYGSVDKSLNALLTCHLKVKETTVSVAAYGALKGSLPMTNFKTTLLALLALALSSCAGAQISDFQGKTPTFNLERYFMGETKAYGLFEDRFGKFRRTFVVDIKGEMDGETLVLTEDFVYDDGETEQRIWRINKKDDGTYSGTFGDIIGEAKGELEGNALHWEYKMNLKVGDDTWKVGFDDWMIMQSDGVMLNRAYVSRWGFEIGQVTLSFVKP